MNQTGRESIPHNRSGPVPDLSVGHFIDTLYGNNLMAKYGYKSKEFREAKDAWEAARRKNLMSELQIFQNETFGQVRTLVRDGEPWFVAADVCRALELDQVTNALRKLDDDERALISIKGISQGNDRANIINEPGLYSLVLGSRKPEARVFKRWITHEVLPAIRKHGAYATDATIDKVLADPEFGIKLLTSLKEEREARKALEADVARKDQLIGEMRPKANYVDWILQNPGLVTITQIAKDYGMSAYQMNRMLHELGVQFKLGNQWLLYKRHHDQGYTHSETIEFVRSDGRRDVNMITKWTQKGRLFIYDILRDERGLTPLIERDGAAS